MFKLRDYQQQLIIDTHNSFLKGHKYVLLVAPCGSGKTVTAAELARLTQSNGGLVYFIVHRKELCDQASKTFESYGVADTKVFMVQTLCRRLKNNPEPKLIIFDESHHTTSNSYKKIIDYYENSYILGLTATPCRLSGTPLGSIFTDMIETVTAKNLISRGFLADYDYYAPTVADFKGVNYKRGEFDAGDVANCFDKPKIYGDIIAHYKKYCVGRKTIIYCGTVEQSIKIVEIFNNNGFSAEHLDGGSKKDHREKIVKKYRDNEINTLSNVNLFGEGFDVPECDCVLLLRRTASLSLYIQMSTRCLRPSKDKRAIILDFCGNCYIHGMPTEDRKWSLTDKIKTRNVSAEPDILSRQCTECYRVFPGNGRVCPYCGAILGKTRAEIKADEKAELEKITAIDKKNKRMEVGMCKTKADLQKVAEERGYSSKWVYVQCKIKGIRR